MSMFRLGSSPSAASPGGVPKVLLNLFIPQTIIGLFLTCPVKDIEGMNIAGVNAWTA